MTITTTRKEIITQKYDKLLTDLTPFIPDKIKETSVLPTIDEDIDFLDLVFLLNLHFISANEDNYKQTINDFLDTHNKITLFTDEQLENIYKLMKEFIFWFKSLT